MQGSSDEEKCCVVREKKLTAAQSSFGAEELSCFTDQDSGDDGPIHIVAEVPILKKCTGTCFLRDRVYISCLAGVTGQSAELTPAVPGGILDVDARPDG